MNIIKYNRKNNLIVVMSIHKFEKIIKNTILQLKNLYNIRHGYVYSYGTTQFLFESVMSFFAKLFQPRRVYVII